MIEDYLKNNPQLCNGVTFKYFDLGPIALTLKKRCNWLNWYYVLWQWHARKKIRCLVREHKASLVHLVTFASFRYPVFLGKAGVPVVWGPVGGGETAPLSLLFHRTRWRSCVKELIRNMATGFSSFFASTINPCSKGGGRVLVSTPRTQKILELKGIQCEIMPTIGLNEGEILCDEKIPTVENGLNFLFVGRLVVLKGIHLLLEAFSQANMINARLTIAGDGPELKHLKMLASKLGVSARVDFIGHVDKKAIHEIYSNHHVLVAPSLYESGGYMVLEAFSHKRPAIVLDVGGLALSVNEQCGIKVPIGSAKDVIEGLAKALLFYHNSPESICEHGAAAKIRSEAIYGWRSKAERMNTLYLSTIEDFP
ncbi:glycosyltransferase family 4 protein [Rubritalea sp.]|uniref:glycosyltransferase family 4 protein n=1 Tax=Rubritalea sp. TaxID=2109375 RepID=UPI003241C329